MVLKIYCLSKCSLKKKVCWRIKESSTFHGSSFLVNQGMHRSKWRFKPYSRSIEISHRSQLSHRARRQNGWSNGERISRARRKTNPAPGHTQHTSRACVHFRCNMHQRGENSSTTASTSNATWLHREGKKLQLRQRCKPALRKFVTATLQGKISRFGCSQVANFTKGKIRKICLHSFNYAWLK